MLNKLRERGTESIAVCLLHSYANPANEERVGRIIRETWPEAGVRSMAMCYEGQGHYVKVPAPEGNLGQVARQSIVESFHSLHRIEYGHQMDAPPKTINVRMKPIGKIREIPVKKNPDVGKDRRHRCDSEVQKPLSGGHR